MTPRPLIWTVRDRLGRQVSLSRDCWDNHILAKRPALEPHVMRFPKVLFDPVSIRRDVDYVTTRQNYYRPAVYPSQPKKYVKIVVELDAPDAAGHTVGTIVTINLVDKIPWQEEEVWPERW